MADTTFSSDLQVQQWQKKFHLEYVRGNRFNRYMGTDENKPIQLVKDLTTKRGQTVTVALVTRLSAAGVTGDDTLRGNEEALSNYGDDITVDQLRNAVSRGDMEQQKGNIDLLNAAKMQLKNWAMEKLRDDIINRLQSPNADGVTTYANSTEAQKDAWLASNGQGVAANRVLFGAALSNNAADDHSAALSNVDGTTDIMDQANVRVLKRLARDSDPHIRPIKTAEDEEWFVLFANKWCFRDLKDDMSTVHQNAAPRSLKENPIFRDGDLVVDGVIVREIVEMPVISGVGAASIDVASNALCGAQAVAVAWAKMTRAIRDEDDYGNIQGVGVAEIRGLKKLFFNSVQHGMATGYFAAVADS